MTRFWITLDQGVGLVLKALSEMRGGEIFVPKIPSMRVIDLARALGPECEIRITGIRPGEKIHETLLTENEAARSRDVGDIFVIEPAFRWWGGVKGDDRSGSPLPGDFRYTSDSNDRWLSPEGLKDLIDGEERAKAVVRR
jgi:UDP-N-acetylglucosamine 4,6-dehydratase